MTEAEAAAHRILNGPTVLEPGGVLYVRVSGEILRVVVKNMKIDCTGDAVPTCGRGGEVEYTLATREVKMTVDLVVLERTTL